MTSSDGHLGSLVGKRLREIVVFYGIYLIFKSLKCVKCTLENCEKNISCITNNIVNIVLIRLSYEKVNYFIILIHIKTRP